MKYFISAVIGLLAVWGFYLGNKNSAQLASDRPSPPLTTLAASSNANNGQQKNTSTAPDLKPIGPSNKGEKTGNEFLAQYKLAAQAGLGSRDTLDKIYALGIDKTTSNFKFISDRLKSNVSKEERVALVRILGEFYTHDDADGLNSRVLSDLRQIAQSNDAEVARAATFSFSRLGYFSDSESILLAAKTAKYIDDQEYYGELAHILPVAPATSQKAIADKIRLGENAYSSEILSSILQDKGALKAISPDALGVIKSVVMEHEPNFPQAPGQFGLLDAVRYSDWLKSIAILNGGTDGRDFNNVLIQHLNDSTIDPRKIISFLVSTDGSQFISAMGGAEAFKKMQERIDTYAKQNQANSTIQEVVSGIREKGKKASH
ncbi:MAG: hypothetical protein V4447_07610 [Pseudomonadota bacterium]